MIKAGMDNRRVANPPVGRTEAVGTLLPSRPLPGTPRGRLNRKTVDRTALQDGPNGATSTWVAGNRRTQDHSRNGVRTLTEWTYDAADQLSRATAGASITTYAFDAAGNRVAEALGADNRSFAWTPDNRLQSLDTGGSISTHAYAGDGLRQRSVGTGVRSFVWDRAPGSITAPLLFEFAEPAQTRIWRRGPLLNALQIGTQNRYLLLDPMGSAMAETDQSGQITARYATDAWGALLATEGAPTLASGYGLNAGYAFDSSAETGYVRQRWLDTRSASWLSIDPLLALRPAAFAHGALETPLFSDPYLYVGNQPTTRLDPSGLTKQKCLIVTMHGFNGYPGDGAHISRVSKELRKRGWQVEEFISSGPHAMANGPLSALNTKVRADEMEALLRMLIPRARCVCAGAYSWGGGTSAHVFRRLANYFTPRRPLIYVWTVDTIQTTPAYFDIEHHAQTEKWISERHHDHWYAGLPMPFEDWIPGIVFLLKARFGMRMRIIDFIVKQSGGWKVRGDFMVGARNREVVRANHINIQGIEFETLTDSRVLRKVKERCEPDC